MRLRSIVFLVAWAAAAATRAQSPPPERISELLREFPELERADDPKIGGYARDPNIRLEVAPVAIENQFSNSLQRLARADLDLYLAETAAENVQAAVDARRRQFDFAEMVFRRFEQTQPAAGAERARDSEDARKSRDLAQQQLQQERGELARVQEAVSAARKRFESAFREEEKARNDRDRWLNEYSQNGCFTQGVAYQRNTILVRFRDEASPVEIREILTRYGLERRNGMPEISLFIVGLKPVAGEPDIKQMVRVNRTVGLLSSERLVFSAMRQGTLGRTTVPAPSALGTSMLCWNWYDNACPFLIGLKKPRFPAAWNFDDAIRRRGNTAVPVAVLDEGFADHEDLAFTRVCTTTSSFHGNFVAGILAARSDNGKGIDGATPFARVLACAPENMFPDCPEDNSIAFTSLMFALRSLLALQPRVINVSLGYNWLSWGTGNIPEKREAIRRFVAVQGAAVRDFLRRSRERNVIIVSAAGNDCGGNSDCKQSAEWTSPLNWAALNEDAEPITPLAKNIFVVESIDANGDISVFSNKKGTLAAPGRGLLGPDMQDGQYTSKPGTSAAAPIVSGVVALMFAYNPDLSLDKVRSILRVGETNPPPAVDAFDALVQSRDDALRDLADLTGDGKVDMADFEVFRSHLKQTESHVFTCDLNGDGLIDSNDALFPRSDLNGDGILSRSSTHRVPGFQDPVTDLEVMKKFWSDPKVKKEDLESLLDK
jgi:hypothetical protein